MSNLSRMELERLKKTRQEKFTRELKKKQLLNDALYEEMISREKEEEKPPENKSFLQRLFGTDATLSEQITAIGAIIILLATIVTSAYILRTDVSNNMGDISDINKQMIVHREDMEKIKKMLGGSDINQLLAKIQGLTDRIKDLESSDEIMKSKLEHEILMIKSELTILSTLVNDQKMNINDANKKIDKISERLKSK